MNILEYQAKEILRREGVRVPFGRVASDSVVAENIARELGGKGWVIKAQVHAGGRGKAGGIKIAKSLDEVRQYSAELLNLSLQTAQTGQTAKKVRQVLIEQFCDIARELYVAVTVDRLRSQVVVIASSEGGVEIEQTAHKNPSAIHKQSIDPTVGLMPYQVRELCFSLGLADKDTAREFGGFISKLCRIFVELDCALAEVNPLIITRGKEVVALDAKFSFDDSAFARHPDIFALRDLDEESPAERMARENGLNYVALDGNIGCMVNGAGLAMATMDSIKVYGGEPANFLDVGGGASKEMITQAFKILMSDGKVRAVLINIFGGILKCDVLAEGIVSACREVRPAVPLVVRLEGTNVEQGRKILKDSGLNIVSESTMTDAARRAVSLAKSS